MGQPTSQYYQHHGDYLTRESAEHEASKLDPQAVIGVSQSKDMNVGVYTQQELSGRLRATAGVRDTFVLGTGRLFTLEEITGQTPLTELETTELVHS
jgi:hypothetical protein